MTTRSRPSSARVNPAAVVDRRRQAHLAPLQVGEQLAEIPGYIWHSQLRQLASLVKPGLQVSQGRDVLKAPVSEGRSVVALGRSQPTQHTRQSVVVVVLGEFGEGSLGVSEARETLTVEDLGLEDVPKGFDFAVGPRRADLGAQVPDAKIAQALAEQGEDSRHPEHEGLAVVAH